MNKTPFQRLSRRPLFAYLLGALGFTLFAGSSFAGGPASLVVTKTADTDDGLCSLVDCSLREAVQAANVDPDTNTITFNIPVATDPGCNAGLGPCTINVHSTVPNLATNLTIQGPGADVLTVRRDIPVDYRIFTINSGATVTISGLTISNGRSANGAGIHNAGTLTVSDSTVSGNYTSQRFLGPGENGGGIFNSGLLTITNSTVRDNHTSNGTFDGELENVDGGDGGGIYNTGTLTVSNSTVSGNGTGIGGSYYHPVIENLGGDNGGDGAGIYNTGTVTITQSTLSDNRCGRGGPGGLGGGNGGSGGGIFIQSGAVTITNSTLSGNWAGCGGFIDGYRGFGNGVDNTGGALTITNSTLNGNYNPCTGPQEVDISESYGIYGGAFFNNSILANSGLWGNCGGGAVASGTNFETGGKFPCEGFTVVTSAQLNLGALADNGGPTQTHALLLPSVAIDAASGATLTTLNGGITTVSQTVFDVADAGAIPAGVGFTIRIGSEQMVVTSKATNTLTVTRGANGTTAATHASGASVDLAFDQRGAGFPRLKGMAVDVGAVERAVAVLPVSLASRKEHGAAGTFDIPLPIGGPVGTECRSGGATMAYQLVVTFAGPVTVNSAAVSSGTGTATNTTVSGNEVIVDLTGVANAQLLTVGLFGVNDGSATSDVDVSVGILLGDTTGNGAVGSSDIGATKSQSGQPVTMTNFRADVTANGAITASDVALVKSQSGTGLPPASPEPASKGPQ